MSLKRKRFLPVRPSHSDATWTSLQSHNIAFHADLCPPWLGCTSYLLSRSRISARLNDFQKHSRTWRICSTIFLTQSSTSPTKYHTSTSPTYNYYPYHLLPSPPIFPDPHSNAISAARRLPSYSSNVSRLAAKYNWYPLCHVDFSQTFHS
jgi:hypothetical protein